VNRQCNVTKRIQTSKGPRYCPVVLSANGRIKPDVVLVGDREERHPEGAYYISWYDGKRLIRLSVGKDAATATARRLQKEAELNAVNNGVTVLPDGQKRVPGDRGILKDRHVRIIIKCPESDSPLRGRIHSRRLSLRPTSSLLQSGGGPYIECNVTPTTF
jgi:hypothetical protein